jgi:adenine-specific DNA-methyltransferase
VAVKPVEALKHKDKRVNIPTEELREFVRSEEEAPKTMLYPRDPSLDPQLVWKGKDEQDREDLAVPVVPIYIQEKIHPQALIEDLRAHSPLPAGEGQGEGQVSLFDDFNGVKDFRQKIDFYSHDLGTQPKWSNRMILGDSLLVMTSLAEKEGLKGKVQMMYMDPPYGIKFGSNWQVSTRKRDVKDGKVEDATRQPEQIKAFRDTWQLGIHSYLSYLRDRLVVARELLTETGSIFVQIGDENVHLVRGLMDEVFGSDNFCAAVPFKKTSGQASTLIAGVCDYLLWYAKSRERAKYRQLYARLGMDVSDESYNCIELGDGRWRRLSAQDIAGQQPSLDHGRFRTANLTSQGASLEGSAPFTFEGTEFLPSAGTHWKPNRKGLDRLQLAGRLVAVKSTLAYKRFIDDFPVVALNNLWTDTVESTFAVDKTYVVQTATKVVERCILMTTDPGDLVLDPTCGSGATAFVAEHWGRRWITIDTSRVALALARTRLMSARYPYYLLMDSPEGRQKEAEVTASTAVLASLAKTEGDIKKGFVYRRVSHVTLKSIASSDEIDTIHARYEEKLVPLRGRLNKQLKESWEEWDVPCEAESGWTASARDLHAEWQQLRRQRQKEIDDSVSRHAETELLFDQPYEDGKRIRVTGPFTVESLSPHRVLSADEKQPVTGAGTRREATGVQFETMILDNLRKAGVQNTRRSERLVFSRLEPFAGGWLQAAGEFTDASQKVRHVAVSIGPEHGTVGQQQIQEAAKEAVKGIGFDLLLVLGFSFDAHASETAKEVSPKGLKPEQGFVGEWEDTYGKLPVLLVRMNPDLAMGDELLKKTGAGNLFMVFGEPDVEIRKQEDGKLVVQIKGVDVYDPTTGVIRSSSTDDIACWFLDTNYNEESFFVRHAYFTGAGDPYEKLKRALRAEINEAAWSTLYSTVSRPFDLPATGKIAIKVINHYGDEVLKVFPAGAAHENVPKGSADP